MSASAFKPTTWLAEVFPSTGRTVSQVIKQVHNCQVVSGHRRCQVASFAFGFRKSLPAAQA